MQLSVFLVNRKYDIILGGIRSDHFNSTKYVASALYLEDDITWCVSRAQPISRWINLFYVVKDYEIYIIGTFLLLSTVLIGYLLLAFEEKPLDLFHLSILILQTICALTSAFKPKTTAIRIHYTPFLIIPFWLTQIYGALLVTFMSRVIYEHQISTVSEIARQHFRLSGDPYSIGFLNDEKMVRFDINSNQIHKFGYSFVDSFQMNNCATLKSVRISKNACCD